MRKVLLLLLIIISFKLHPNTKQNLVDNNVINKHIDSNLENINKLNIAKIEREILKERFERRTKLVNTLFIIFSLTIVILILILIRINIINNINSRKLRDIEKLADSAIRVKSQFISTVTHEIRTPLYGIVGMMDIIESDIKHGVTEKDSFNKYMDSLKFSTNHLLTLINDILQVQKIEENRIVLEDSNIFLEKKIKSVIDSLGPMIASTDNKISYKIDESVPKFIVSDRIRITQILFNILSNSLKFTKNGDVSININVVNGLLEFQIKDSGIGIAKENLDLVFENFIQLNRNNDDYQGTGLGLPIVKRLVHLLGGDIKLESEVGIGTKVTFTIMLKEGSEELVINKKIENMKEYKALVVDDNSINQIVTKKVLSSINISSKSTDNGLTAISMLENNEFDLILMDLNMPIIDGYDTTRIIRKSNSNIPIIGFTAFDREEVITRAIESGMDDVITKPIDKEKLHKLIESVM